MLLGTKNIEPTAKRRYVLDYDSFLDIGETLTSLVFTVSAGSATATQDTIATDGRSVSFFVTGALTTTPTFNVNVTATTSLTQIIPDHVVFHVVSA